MLPDGLSMLWESTAAGEALSERFGFATVDDAAAWCADALQASWGLDVASVGRVVISSQNAIVWASTDRGDVVVKWSRAAGEFARLDASTHLIRMLADRGLPVARPFSSRRGGDRAVLDGPVGALSVAVLPELRGAWLDVADPAAVRAAGATLAELHSALAAIEVDQALAMEPVDWRARVQAWLAESADTAAPDARSAIDRLARLLAAAPNLEHRAQLIHNDYRAANILTRGSTIVGLLDFDDVAVTHPVYDVAKASVYLGTLFTDWGPTEPAVREAFRAGYESIRPLGDVETLWLEIMTLWLGLSAAQTQAHPERWLAAL